MGKWDHDQDEGKSDTIMRMTGEVGVMGFSEVLVGVMMRLEVEVIGIGEVGVSIRSDVGVLIRG